MENVRTENRDGVLIITVDRPKVLNALNAQTVEEIGEAFEADQHARILVRKASTCSSVMSNAVTSR